MMPSTGIDKMDVEPSFRKYRLLPVYPAVVMNRRVSCYLNKSCKNPVMSNQFNWNYVKIDYAVSLN